MSLPVRTKPAVEKKTTKAVRSTTTTAQNVADKDPRSYFAMMLLAVLLLPTGLARAYRGDSSGWTRFWIYIAVNVVMIIPFIGVFIGIIPLLVLVVLGIIDVFQLRKVTTDAYGVALIGSPKDRQWANAFYIYFIVTLVMVAILIVFVTSLIGVFVGNYENSNGSFDQLFSPQPETQEFLVEPDSF